MNEAAARIKINKLLEAAGWLFFAEKGKPANIRLEPSVTIKTSDLDALGNDFEKTATGYIDFLLLDDKGFPLVVLEAKQEKIEPLAGKEQARATSSTSSSPSSTRRRTRPCWTPPAAPPGSSSRPTSTS